MRRLSFLIYSENPKTVDVVSEQLSATGRIRVVAVVADVRELLDTITGQALDGVYIDLDSRPALALDAVEETDRSGTLLFTGGSRNEAELLIRAMRLGARDFFLEHNLIGIAEHLKGKELESTQGIGAAPVIAVVGAKGGVGATTVVCELAIALAHKGMQVSVVDLSRRIGDVAMYFDLRPPNGVADIARRSGELDSDFLDAVAAAHSSGVSIFAASNDIEDVAALTWSKLDRALKLMRVDYDCVILDVPWDFDEYSIRAAGVADEILQITTPEVLSLTHARIQRSALDRLGVSGDHIRVVLNRLSDRATLTVEQMGEHLGAPIVASLPEDYEAASKCADEGLTFGEVEGGEPVVQAVHKLRSAVAEWFQLDLTEVEEEHDTSLVKRLRGWMGRG